MKVSPGVWDFLKDQSVKSWTFVQVLRRVGKTLVVTVVRNVSRISYLVKEVERGFLTVEFHKLNLTFLTV